MYKDLMPIGSIVRLIGGTHRVMICGRIVCKAGEDKIYDYVGCLYPEGMTSSEKMFFFNRDAIETVFFIGFQDEDEFKFRQALNQLGELEAVDGKIVKKSANAD